MEINKLFTTVDTHTAGEPLRIITSGLPFIKGNTMLERRAYFREYHDHIRQILMYEPRGHHGMYGCVMTPSVSSDADFGVLFMHNEGFSTMCGHGIIAVVTAAIETGIIETGVNKTERTESEKGETEKGETKKSGTELIGTEMTETEGDLSRFVIDTPAGKVIARASHEGSVVHSVAFENVPSFVFATDVPVSVGENTVHVDVAFGGAFYAIVQAQDIGVDVEIDQLAHIQKLGQQIKESVSSALHVQHPTEPELEGIYGVIVSDHPQRKDSHLRNVTVFADGQIDRSPCGTGTSARMAALHHHGKLATGQSFIHEGIVNTQLEGNILSTMKVGEHPAIVPQIKGRASVTGLHQFVVDPDDPLQDGFLLG